MQTMYSLNPKNIQNIFQEQHKKEPQMLQVQNLDPLGTLLQKVIEIMEDFQKEIYCKGYWRVCKWTFLERLLNEARCLQGLLN